MSKKPRLPPGQRWINGFPVRTAERMPEPFNPETWNLTIEGEVENPIVFPMVNSVLYLLPLKLVTFTALRAGRFLITNGKVSSSRKSLTA